MRFAAGAAADWLNSPAGRVATVGAMKLGLVIFPTDRGIQPVELAREAEARGFDSLWFPEHSHIPSSRRTPWGGREGGLKLATGITLVAQRDPLWLAKEVATLDQLSGGRFLFGIGYGWNHEEMAGHGVDIKRRRKVVREKILACKRLWTEEEASFAGEYVNFEASWAWPKPVQFPHPPIVVGASATELHFRHIIEYGDAWMPIEGRFPVAEGWAALTRQATESGRDPASLQLGVFGARPDSARLAELRDTGASWVALGLPPLDRDAALATLDRYAPLVEEFNR
ncbi:MAG: putative oxidoreductase [Acidimicrobiaceae bacterium]|nr:MAG: putative oxidoreductase [Acidimicrobiaceae bacterium]